MKLWIIVVLFFPIGAMAQVAPEKYWIQFSDKDNTPYSIAQPESFLSPRAITRRERQGIAITQRDLPVDPEYIAQVRATGAEMLSVSKWMNAITFRTLDNAVLQQVLALPFVVNSMPVGKQKSAASEWSKWDEIAVAKSIEVPIKVTDYGTAFNQIDMLGGVLLHQQNLMGQGMMIAVLDGGFSSADQLSVFDSLRQNGRLVGTWDIVGRNSNVYGYSSHGTAVLSTMAAYQPGVMIGTAPKASYLLIRTEDVDSEFPIEEDYWIAGAEYADSAGADIINSSLGYTTFDDPFYDHSYADMNGQTTHGARAANMAAATGILVVNSAGNSGNNPWKYIGTPADADSALAIGAVNATHEYASFSSIGPSSDGRVKPNVCAQGQLAIVAGTLGGVGPSNGTSFSGPIMAGMAACLWQSNSNATNMQVFESIERSAHIYTAPTAQLGYGIPYFPKARVVLAGYNPTNLEQDELLTAFPNPFTSELKGAFFSAINQDLEFQLVNSMGQQVQIIKGVGCETCVHEFRFTGLNSLQAGTYYIYATSKEGKFHSKMIKVD